MSRDNILAQILEGQNNLHKRMDGLSADVSEIKEFMSTSIAAYKIFKWARRGLVAMATYIGYKVSSLVS